MNSNCIKVITHLASLFFTLAISDVKAETLYKCAAADGGINYQATKCAGMKEIATKYIGGARGSSTGGSVEIKTSPNQYNAFFTDVSINGTPMNMIVDTGAAYVSIPLQMAGKLGLSQGTAQAMSTANGVALSYLTTIATLKIGNITLKNVAAQLTPNGTPYGLLGQSALSQLMVTQMDGTMMLRSKPQ